MHRFLCCAAAVFGILAEGHAVAVAQDPDSFPAIYRIQPSHLAIPAPGVEDVLGYPAVSVDKLVVLDMLRQRRFDDLDQYLTGLQDTVRGRIQREFDLVDASRAFATADTTLGPLIQQWISAKPRSAHARTAEASWYLASAWFARGHGSAGEVGARAWQEVAQDVERAVASANAALMIDSAQMMAYAELLGSLTLQGDRVRARTVLDAGRQWYRGSYYLPHQFLYLLQPRWGGSHEAMQAFASEIAADSVINPRLRTFLGAVEADESANALMADDFDGAVGHATAALRYGPEFYFLLQRGHARVYFTDNGRGITDLNLALAQRPQYPDALTYHAFAALSSARYSKGGEREFALHQAIRDFESILSFDPMDPDARDGLKKATYELKTCPEYFPECGGSEAGPAKVFTAVWRDVGGYLAYLGVLAFVSWFGFFRWVRGGLRLPGYVHLLAVLALITIGYLDYLWVQTGAPMTLRRWILIPFFPGLVYFLFVGLGGAGRGRG